jgi:hypothetical protein
MKQSKYRQYQMTIHEVSVDEVEMSLLRASSPELLEELSKFGALLLNEVSARTTSIDSKASSIVGWTPVVLTGLLAVNAITPQVSGFAIGVSVALVGGAFWFAFSALRVREWEWPSTDDWFRNELLSDPTRLRIFHLLGMLETHQKHHRFNLKKGDYLRTSQWMLFGAVIAIAIMNVPDKFWLVCYFLFKRMAG